MAEPPPKSSLAEPPPKSSLAAQIMAASEGAAPKVAEAIVYLKPVAKPVRCHPPHPAHPAYQQPS